MVKNAFFAEMVPFQINLKMYALLALIFVHIALIVLIVFNARKDSNIIHLSYNVSNVDKIKYLKMEDVYVISLVF